MSATLSPQKIAQKQRAIEKKRAFLLFLFFVVCILSLIFDIMTGPSLLPFADVWQALFQLGDVDETTKVIVHQLRLPMAMMALVVGAALGVGGAEIQTLLNNPMASPYTLGLAAAAGLGASIVIAFGGFGLPMEIAVPIGAFAMTLLSSAILFAFASLRRFSSAMLVLVGIALLFLFQSLLSLIQFISAPEISQQILFWLFGNLTKATWQTISIAAGVTSVSILLLLKDAWKLTALRLGEARALSLGINLSWLRMKTLLIVSVMTATCISFVGIIGFIGLVAPHIARLLVGEDQRFFLPGSMLVGAAFLSMSSVLSKSLVPGALFPVGIITALVGVPFFFWIVLAKR
ncbi:iron ABC transporter permease [Mannheimia varigena]|uniref:FecCD family ABC transporter permease n=1 Tax=Mannheimia varigena TaxID=85404 RepID=UPI00159DE162|nr:iron ABC transporter permease [Mannheimia varigena]QLB17459.1 iron ABC transporter permease [Mannheimia varigena]